MTPFSARYAAAIGVVVALVLAPATLRALLAPQRSECASPADFLQPTRFDPWSQLVTEGTRPSRLDKERLVAVVEDPDEPRRLVYSVVRFRTLANALLQPPSALPGTREPDQIESRVLESDDGPIPVTFGLEMRGSQIRTTAHFMTYDGAPIESPFWTRVRGSLDALVSGPLPITLFVASTYGHTSDQDRVEARLEAWMRNAWAVYRDVCLGGGAGGS